MTTALLIFAIIAATFVAFIQFIAELDGTGVLALFRSLARWPQLVLVGVQLAVVLLAAAMISISSGWAAVAWKAAGVLFAGVMILCVRTIRWNLAPGQASPVPSRRISAQPSILRPRQPPNLRPPSPRFCARLSRRFSARPSPRFSARPSPRIPGRPAPQNLRCHRSARRSPAHLICRALMWCAYSDFSKPAVRAAFSLGP